VRLPWKRLDRGRLFEVECECGEQFRVPFDPETAEPRPDDPLLVPLEGRCPWCGLMLEQIEPFGGSGRSG
jgi:hypothetical protein